MRAWVYNRVLNLGWPTSWANVGGKRVISSGSADQPKKPFLLVSMGVEQPPLGMPASSKTQSIPFTVWVHDEPGSMVRIDDMAMLVKAELPTNVPFKIGNLSVYEVRWVETGDDAYDDHFMTNARPVRFSAMTRR